MLECQGQIRNPGQPSTPCTKIFPRKIGYVFQSEAWKAANFHIVELTKVTHSHKHL